MITSIAIMNFGNSIKRMDMQHTNPPAGALITQADNGTWACDIHRYQKVLEKPDRSLGASSFTIEPVEQHFRKDPKPHLEALIEIANNKYEVKINERKQLTLE